MLDLNNILTKTNENVYKKNFNIFSNSSLINQYFIYKNQKISYPDGFSTALNDDQLEVQMINSFKSMGYSKLDFKKYLSNKVTWRSYNEIIQISGFKYQFSDLYTYSNKSDYSKEEINFLKNKRFILSESIALPKKEIIRLLDKFDQHKIIDSIKPDIIIIDKRQNNMQFILSDDYSEILDTNFFSLMKLK